MVTKRSAKLMVTYDAQMVAYTVIYRKKTKLFFLLSKHSLLTTSEVVSSKMMPHITTVGLCTSCGDFTATDCFFFNKFRT